MTSSGAPRLPRSGTLFRGEPRPSAVRRRRPCSHDFFAGQKCHFSLTLEPRFQGSHPCSTAIFPQHCKSGVPLLLADEKPLPDGTSFRGDRRGGRGHA